MKIYKNPNIKHKTQQNITHHSPHIHCSCTYLNELRSHPPPDLFRFSWNNTTNLFIHSEIKQKMYEHGADLVRNTITLLDFTELCNKYEWIENQIWKLGFRREKNGRKGKGTVGIMNNKRKKSRKRSFILDPANWTRICQYPIRPAFLY